METVTSKDESKSDDSKSMDDIFKTQMLIKNEKDGMEIIFIPERVINQKILNKVKRLQVSVMDKKALFWLRLKL